MSPETIWHISKNTIIYICTCIQMNVVTTALLWLKDKRTQQRSCTGNQYAFISYLYFLKWTLNWWSDPSFPLQTSWYWKRRMKEALGMSEYPQQKLRHLIWRYPKYARTKLLQMVHKYIWRKGAFIHTTVLVSLPEFSAQMFLLVLISNFIGQKMCVCVCAHVNWCK